MASDIQHIDLLQESKKHQECWSGLRKSTLILLSFSTSRAAFFVCRFLHLLFI